MFKPKHDRIKPVGSFMLPSDPEHPGFYRTIEGEAWVYWVMPDHPPMYDAPDARARTRAATPLARILVELGRLVPTTGMTYRKLVRRFYRDIHVLAISTPIAFTASRTLDPATRGRLMMDHKQRTVRDRITLIGVRLVSGGRIPGRNWLLGQLEDMGYTAAYGMEASSSYMMDAHRIERILASAGCRPPTDLEWERAKAWWQTSRQPNPMPALVEAGHIHTFPSWRAAEAAEQYKKTGVPCSTWMQQDSMRHSFPMSFVALGPLPFEGRDELSDPDAMWAARLLADRRAGGDSALAVSLRGAVEPGRLTAKQMRRDEEKLLNAVNRRMEDGAMGGADKVKDESHLDQLSGLYETDGKAPPTLVDASCLACLPQLLDEEGDGQVTGLTYPGIVKFNPQRQEAAFQAMQVGSSVDYDPSPVVWPAPIVTYAGFNGCATAGEDSGQARKSDAPGALLGFTEADRQPVYVSVNAASATSREPLMIVIGGTGSGKTWLVDHLCAQWSEMPNPTLKGRGMIPGVIFDPKQKSDFQDFVRAAGGVVRRLDEPGMTDGVLDPVKCMTGSKDFRDEMTNTVVAMLSSITDPTNVHPERQADLMAIVDYGLARGADCTGEAVRMAARDHQRGRDLDSHGRPLVPDSVVEVMDVIARHWKSSTMFRIICGMRHGTPALKTSNGLTLLMAGELNLIPSGDTVTETIKRWVVRMSALGAAAAMMGRGGYVFIDEAWILLGDSYGAQVAQQFGRLGRLQKYLPIFASQRVQEFLDAKLQSFFSRGILLSVSGRGEGTLGGSEAGAALKLFGLPSDGVVYERVTALPITDSKSKRPNWVSLKALKDPDSGRVARGAVCYYIGLDGEATPVEVTIPDRLIGMLPEGK